MVVSWPAAKTSRLDESGCQLTERLAARPSVTRSDRDDRFGANGGDCEDREKLSEKNLSEEITSDGGRDPRPTARARPNRRRRRNCSWPDSVRHPCVGRQTLALD